MIRPLRQRHRRAVFALGIILPIALITGLTIRRPLPAIPTEAEGLTVASPHLGQVIWVRSDLWPQFSIRTRLLSDDIGTQGFSVELTVTKDIVKPDLIVYWAPGKLKVGESLPDDSVLLGALVQTAPTELRLPPEVNVNGGGALLLYSLADHETVAVSEAFTFTRMKPGTSP